jgi:hypothetical protein
MDGLSNVPDDKETAVVQLFLPKIQKKICEVSQSDLLLLTDSQKCRWLLQDPGCDDVNKLGPDGIVALRPFVEIVRNNSGAIKGAQPALDCQMLETIRCTYEWKLAGAMAASTLGQLLIYHQKLPNVIQHVRPTKSLCYVLAFDVNLVRMSCRECALTDISSVACVPVEG